MRKIFAMAVFLSVFGIAFAQDDAGAVLKKMDNTFLAVKDKSARVEMQMISLNSGKTKIKKAMLYQKGLDHKLFRYIYPKSDSGIASLNIPGAVYLYMPMFKTPKKVTNMAKSNAFNKSDFSLEDANTKPYAQRFTPKMLENNADAYVLDLIPKEGEQGPYSHLKVTINKQHYYPEKIEYFDKNDQKVKEANYKFVKIGNLWVSSSVSMKNLKRNHETKFIMSDIKINQGLDDDVFKVENMVKE